MQPDDRDRAWAVIEARDASLAEARATIAAMQAELERKEAKVQEKEEALVGLTKSLEQKEDVIRKQETALDAYRGVFFIFGPFIRLAVWLLRPIYHALRPRLGILHQYQPRSLDIPAHYRAPRPLERTPRITIVTPSFRHGAFIERTIESVLDQRYPDLEYFVQDGGSEDGTREILERCGTRLTGWESKPDRGQAHAINLGLARGSGEIMAYLNSDDMLLPGALAYVADFFIRHPDVDVVYGHRILVDEEDRDIGRWMMPPHSDEVLSWVDYVPQETLFWRRSMWEKVGGRIDESFRFAMDWDLLVRFRDAGARFARLPRFLAAFRVHGQQKTSSGISDIGFAEMNRIRERVLGRVPSAAEVRKAVLPYLLRHVATDLRWRIQSGLGVHT